MGLKIDPQQREGKRDSAYTHLGEDLAEGFHGAVREANVWAVFVHTGALDEPRLRGPAGGDAGGGGKHSGDVMDA